MTILHAGENMGKLSLIVSAALSFFVTVLNFTDHRFINGTFMGVMFVSTLIALLGELKRQAKK
ncbi:hypothetical protein [Bacillus sp. OV322]|uniref:hypothetical protein n=1 Tax=Bacillus sp. OV322 TaxID=1882764 RepID=UPI0015A5457F|nr:hypothetical protein [Bacillus sp. OV322]